MTRTLPLWLFGLGMTAVAGHGSANTGLQDLLSCRDAGVIGDDGGRLQAAAEAAGFTCRTHRGVRADSLACSGSNIRVLNAPVREFERARQADGSAVLSVVLNAGHGAVNSRFQQTLGSENDGGGVIVAELDTREDGRAELRCRLAGDRPPHGAITGSLDFRGQQPLPAMRVCATPVSPQNGAPRCVQTRTGEAQYLIEQLPAGEYYLTAFATEGNPNRLFGVYSSPMRDCAAGDATCAQRRLQPVTVLPGDVRSGIDPHTLLPELPSTLRNRVQ